MEQIYVLIYVHLALLEIKLEIGYAEKLALHHILLKIMI